MKNKNTIIKTLTIDEEIKQEETTRLSDSFIPSVLIPNPDNTLPNIENIRGNRALDLNAVDNLRENRQMTDEILLAIQDADNNRNVLFINSDNNRLIDSLNQLIRENSFINNFVLSIIGNDIDNLRNSLRVVLSQNNLENLISRFANSFYIYVLS